MKAPIEPDCLRLLQHRRFSLISLLIGETPAKKSKHSEAAATSVAFRSIGYGRPSRGKRFSALHFSCYGGDGASILGTGSIPAFRRRRHIPSPGNARGHLPPTPHHLRDHRWQAKFRRRHRPQPRHGTRAGAAFRQKAHARSGRHCLSPVFWVSPALPFTGEEPPSLMNWEFGAGPTVAARRARP
jgi:hypothetical protein